MIFVWDVQKVPLLPKDTLYAHCWAKKSYSNDRYASIKVLNMS